MSGAVVPVRDVNGLLPADQTADQRAVEAWLMARGQRSRHTFDAYRRESHRLLVWLAEQSLSLSTLSIDQVHAYYHHLQHPPATWIRPRKPFKDQPLLDTQLLIEGLSDTSLAYTRRVLAMLFDYLLMAGYVPRNVIRLSQQPLMSTAIPTERILEPSQWQWFWQWLNARPRQTAVQDAHMMRDRWLFLLLYYTGLRREEVAQARMGDLLQKDSGWVLKVVGKGHKTRYVTIHAQLMDALAEYRYWLGLLSAVPQVDETIPLVCGVQKMTALTPRAIGMIVQRVSNLAAQECPDLRTAKQLEQLSTHWLRHTNATHRLMAGASLETTQDELGHADPKTTRIYAKTLDQQRRADVDLLHQLMQNMQQ